MSKARDAGVNVDFILDQFCPALEDDTYTQGKGFLKQSLNGIVQHCCLGVVCELRDVYNVETPLGPSMKKTYFVFGKDGRFEDVLPVSIAEEIFGPIEQRIFATANDNGVTFREISASLRRLCTDDAYFDEMLTLSERVKAGSTGLHSFVDVLPLFRATK